jgi:hypothetical protein
VPGVEDFCQLETDSGGGARYDVDLSVLEGNCEERRERTFPLSEGRSFSVKWGLGG